MKLALIAITEDGVKVAERIKKNIECELTVYVPQKLKQTRMTTVCYSKSFGEQVGEIFSNYEGLIFIMASGIVVRTIAPYIKDKYVDPAVVVVDDVGRFVISLLSGHEGGANNLAYKIANILNTDAVITTGTEAKKDLILGIGCKRGIGSREVKAAIHNALKDADVSVDRVRLAGTVDLKADEAGLLSALDELGIPLRVVSRPEIDTCVKDYSKSDFVINKIGVGGVCEPAALISGRKTKLILRKQKYPGITIAIAQENFSW